MSIKKGELSFFAYNWTVEESPENTLIRIYGVTKDGKNVYVRVDDFTPYCYVELPSNIDWTTSRKNMVVNKLSTLGKQLYRPVVKEFVMRKKLYYAHKELNTEDLKSSNNLKYKDKLFPFLFFAFRSTDALKSFSYSMKKEIEISNIGKFKFNLHEAEYGVSPILKLLALRKLPPAGWIKVKGNIILEDKESTFHYEIACSYNNLYPIESDEVAQPKVISFDNEANSTITSAMPDHSKSNDKIFQIGFATDINNIIQKYLYSLGKPDPKKVGYDVIIKCFKTEADLLVGLTDFIKEEDINIVIGYNILGWDIDYMIKRSKMTKCLNEFKMMGCLHGKIADETPISFGSKAYEKQKMITLSAEGRLFLDLLPIIKRSGHKLVNYRLGTVTTHFGLPTKDPLTPQDIFRCYREFTPESLGEVGKYCCQDAYITLLLYKKLQTWFGLCEMAKTAHVPIFYLFTQGTQIQMLSQVMEYCMYNNFVIISNGYVPKPDESYEGAICLDPIPNKYKKALSFDFASLYPSIMMAYNIDYSTLVLEPKMYIIDPFDVEKYLEWKEFPCYIKCCGSKISGEIKHKHDLDIINIIQKIKNKSELEQVVNNIKTNYPKKIILIQKQLSDIPDEDCHVFEWYTHNNCGHDENRPKKKNGEFSKAKRKIICGSHYYRFVKASVGGEGVVPILLQSLISRRKKTREQIKINEKEMKSIIITLLKKGINKKLLEEFKLQNKKLFEDLNVEESKEKLSNDEEQEYFKRLNYLDTINNVYEQRQLSYKICANAMYGAMGVRKGYLPLMPGAVSITYRGRKAIEFISTYIPETYGGITIYGDSVTGDTPLLIRYPNKTIDIKTIDNIGIKWKPHEGFKHEEKNRFCKEQSHPFDEIEVWTDGKWSKIQKVIRHKVNKKLYRVSTHTGTIDVTEDHSLINYLGKEVKPTESKVGDLLKHSFPNEFEDFIFIKLSMIDEKEAFIWGVFMSKGDCNTTWSISSNDYELLETCKNILTKKEELDFKIINITDNLYKLVEDNTNIIFNKYQELFYHNDNKVIPYIILNSDILIKSSFCEGYSGKRNSNFESPYVISIIPSRNLYGVSFECNTKIESQGLYFLLNSLGYKHMSSEFSDKNKIIINIPYYPNIFLNHHKIKSIIELPNDNYSFVYDLETEEGIFQAGIGQLVVKNTDSSHIFFPRITDNKDAVDLADKVVEEMENYFPKPMKLEFEKIYEKYLILTKKRYIALVANKKGEIIELTKRGICLARRDNCKVLRDIYLKSSELILNDEDKDIILDVVLTGINSMFERQYNYKAFVITKTLKQDIYKTKTLPAQVQQSIKMKNRGMSVGVGSRIEYLFTTACKGEKHFSQGEKVEDVDYFKRWRQYLRVDFLYYLEKQLIKPLDELLKVGLGIENFVLKQFELRKKKENMMDEIKDLFRPNIIIDGESELKKKKRNKRVKIEDDD